MPDSRTDGTTEPELSPGDYCRQVESYLCRRNGGHLVRIVGPAFEMVTGWAESGIPLNVVFRGIDRYVGRLEAKGRRRWPARIDFCQNDVLDEFDAWKRAVGVTVLTLRDAEPADSLDVPGDPGAGRGVMRRTSLPAHLERVVVRLSSLLAGGDLPDALRRTLEQAVGAVDAARASARIARGEARQALIEQLARLETKVEDAALATAPPDVAAGLRAEAERDLAGFRGRMTDAAYADSLAAATRRLLRERLRLPQIAPR